MAENREDTGKQRKEKACMEDRMTLKSLVLINKDTKTNNATINLSVISYKTEVLCLMEHDEGRKMHPIINGMMSLLFVRSCFNLQVLEGLVL